MNSYFTHDSNARNSDKLIPLRAKMGAEGYGIYFMLLERLREEPEYASVKDYNMLAFDLRVDAAKVKAVVENFGLFAFTDDGKCFYSESFLRRMRVKDEKSEKARQSARSRWEKCERNANAQKSNAIKEKKRKEKNTKEETLSVSPSFQSVDTAEEASDEPTQREREDFFRIFFFKNYKNPAEQVERFVNHYKANGWRRSGGSKIVDRVALADSWEPKDADAKNRFKYPFMQFWGEAYRQLSEIEAAIEELPCMYLDLIGIQGRNDAVVFYVTDRLASYMRRSYERVLKPCWDRFYPNMKMKYEIVNHANL